MTANQIAWYQARTQRLVQMEQQRSNLAQEQETYRSNVARETETNRSNVAKESENYRSNVAKERETVRSNIAKELETRRSNVAQESETHRSNVAREKENRLANLETRRSNIARETENVRANQAGEAINWYKALETKRHNVWQDNLDQASTYYANTLREAQTRGQVIANDKAFTEREEYQSDYYRAMRREQAAANVYATHAQGNRNQEEAEYAATKNSSSGLIGLASQGADFVRNVIGAFSDSGSTESESGTTESWLKRLWRASGKGTLTLDGNFEHAQAMWENPQHTK